MTKGGQLRGPQHPAHRRGLDGGDRAGRAAGAAAPGAIEQARAALFDHREKRVRPGSTTRSSPAGTACSSRRWPRRRPPWAGPTGWRRPGPTPGSCSDELRRPDGRAAALVAGRRHAGSRRPPGPPPRLRRGLRRPARGAGEPGRGRRRRLAGPGRGDRRRPVRPVRRPRRVLHDRHGRRGPHHPAPRRLRQRHPVGQLTGRQRAAAPGRPDGRKPLAGSRRGRRAGRRRR